MALSPASALLSDVGSSAEGCSLHFLSSPSLSPRSPSLCLSLSNTHTHYTHAHSLSVSHLLRPLIFRCSITKAAPPPGKSITLVG